MRGVRVSPGIAIGKALVLKEENVSIEQKSTRSPGEELEGDWDAIFIRYRRSGGDSTFL